jgi:hypothetical protein
LFWNTEKCQTSLPPFLSHWVLKIWMHLKERVAKPRGLCDPYSSPVLNLLLATFISHLALHFWQTTLYFHLDLQFFRTRYCTFIFHLIFHLRKTTHYIPEGIVHPSCIQLYISAKLQRYFLRDISIFHSFYTSAKLHNVTALKLDIHLPLYASGKVSVTSQKAVLFIVSCLGTSHAAQHF